jgi:hypothetical protein
MTASAARVELSVVIVSYNTRDLLMRCLQEVTGQGREVIVVDNGSTDGSQDAVRHGFPDAALIEPASNLGYGGANNLGARSASADLVLLLNADAWPVVGAIEALVARARAETDVGVVGPRLRGIDGALQRSVRGFPTVWRICTEYFFLRKLAPGSEALNAFYGAGFAYESERDADFLMGAVLLVKREAFEQIGGFDERFFMFSEEVDLCDRLRQAGYRTVFTPTAEFVHVGGASTAPAWNLMYRQQLRGHILFLDLHHGRPAAESCRRWLIRALRLRQVVFPGPRGAIYRSAADWLDSVPVGVLVQLPV